VAYQAFELVRTQITGSTGTAFAHARSVVRLERWTWTYHEQRVQRWVLSHRLLVEAADAYYGTVHFVGPPVVLWWLWRRHGAEYTRWRNVLIVSSLVAMVGFAVYPLAPPRLMPAAFGFVDTQARFGGLGPLDSGPLKDLNPYAAMPSLHLAWATWCAFVVAYVGRPRWLKVAAFGYPALTLLVVMGTANHWFLDAVGGWLVLAVGWALSVHWSRPSGPKEVRTHA